MNPFRFILLGCGARAWAWDRVVFRNSATMSICAYVNRTLAKAQQFAAQHPEENIPCFAAIEEALAAVEADGVLMVTPPEVHKQQLAAIVPYKLPIIAEKPLAMTLAEGVAMLRMAEAAGTPLSMSLQFRYLPVSRELRRLCETKELGEPGFGLFSYIRNRNGMRPDLNKYPLTMEHPMLLEQTIHHYDLIRYCYNSEPIWIQCHTWNPTWSMYAHDSNVMTLMELENGMRVSYFGTWTSGYNGPKEIMFNWRTDFSSGVSIQEDVFEHLKSGKIDASELQPFQEPDFQEFIDDTELLLRDFISAVRRGSPVPCSGADHLRSLAMTEASIESSRTGNRVYLSKYLW